MTCPACASDQSADRRFCGACGAALAPVDAPPAGPTRRSGSGILELFRRADILQLAFALVLALAVIDVLKSLINLLLNLIAIPGDTQFSGLSVKVGGGVFNYGNAIESVITLVVTGLVVYWVARKLVPEWGAAREPARTCPQCLMVIPVAARRCGHCTTVLDD